MDLSQYSDEQLQNIASGQTTQPDFSHLSDEQLQKISDQKTGNDSGPLAASVYGMSDMLPFVNKASDFLGAAGAKAYDVVSGTNAMQGQSILDLAKQAQADTSATMDASPIAANVGRLAGFAGSLGVPLAEGKALYGAADAAIPASGGLSSLANYAAKTLGSAGVGALNGAVYGAGSSPIGQEGQGAISGAEGGAIVGATIPAALGVGSYGLSGIRNVTKGIGANGPEALDEVAQKLKSQSSKSYQTMRNVDANILPTAADNIITNIESAISSSGKLNPRLHGDTLSVIDDLKSAVTSKASNGDDEIDANILPTAANALGLEDLDQYRQLLGQVRNKNTDITGKLNPDGRLASIAMKAIDDSVDKLTGKDLTNGGNIAIDALNDARDKWAQYRRYDTVSNIVQKAGGDPNKIKSGLQRFVSNKKNIIGYSDDEIDALKDASKYSIGEGVMKGLGKFGFDSQNFLTPSSGAALAAFVGGAPAAATLTGAGTLARYGQRYLARGKAQTALDLLASR